MKIDFSGKVAFITGAAGGIGFAAAKMFAEAGARVAMADIDYDGITRAATLLGEEGHDICPLALDVANEREVEEAICTTVEHFGRIDLAYNNVGIHAPVCPLADAERTDFDRVLAINLGGIWNCTKHEVCAMLKNGTDGGRIVNCSSQSGLVGAANIAAYTASKHGVLGLTKCAALEYARHGIRINAICPGTSDTPMVQKAAKGAPEHMAAIIEAIPLGRMGRAEEIASAVLWLCSDYAGFAVGQTIAIDGGYTIC